MDIEPGHVTIDRQLEALKHEWKNFPLLRGAVWNARQLFAHPEKYIVNKDGKSIPLGDFTKSGKEPLSWISYLYEIPSSEKETASFPLKKSFAQVCFKLFERGTKPRPADFSPVLAIIHATVDERGEILPKSADSWELREEKGVDGILIISPSDSSLLEETRQGLQKEIDFLSRPNPVLPPNIITYYDYEGKQVDVLPISSSKE